MPNKIIVIGCCGSGKSTFSRALSEKTGIEVVHLDRLYWMPNWKNVSSEEFDRRLHCAMQAPRWILDGNFDRTLFVRAEACDCIVWLDLPRYQCLWGVCKRVWKYHGKERPDMGEGCFERFDVSFLRYVWNFNRRNRAKLQALTDGAKGKRVYILHSRREFPKALDAIARECRG